MKIRRVAAQLFIHEFAERGLLFGTALEKQQHAGNGRGNGCGLRGWRVIRCGLRGGAKRRERQYQSKNEEGIAKHQRLEFHIPPMLADLNSVPTQSIRTERVAIHAEEQLSQRASRGRGLDRKRFTIKRVKGITGYLKTL